MILFEFITLFPPKIELVGILNVSPPAHLKGNAIVTFHVTSTESAFALSNAPHREISALLKKKN